MIDLWCDPRWSGAHGIGRFAAELLVRCRMRPLPLSGRPLDVFDSWQLRQTLRQLRPAHFFSPGFNPPLGHPCPFSFTLHDLIHLDVEEERSAAKSLYYRAVVKPAVRRAEVIFTVSEHSRQRIADWAGVNAEQIIVAGNGVGSKFNPDGPRWQHSRPYLLYVGNQKPHKNVEGLVSAFTASGLAADFDLLLTGRLSTKVDQKIATSSMGQLIRGLGEVPEEDLPSLYRGAHALVMPSRYEGFGLSVLEAMACGTPVLSSNRTSLPEVGGEAVAYFDPDNLESFVEGLRSLYHGSLLSEQRARGIARARLFDWDRVAQRVMQGIGVCSGEFGHRVKKAPLA